MMIVRGIRVNKVSINPYGLWEVGVEKSHMHCMNQEGKMQLRIMQRVEAIDLLQALFMSFFGMCI